MAASAQKFCCSIAAAPVRVQRSMVLAPRHSERRSLDVDRGTEHVGPVIFWRKELRDGSGGAGRFRGGLGQVVEISPTEGHEMHFNAMFDRIEHPARGRNGGENGEPGAVLLDDGTRLASKGRQHVPAGRRLILQLPGGGGYGPTDKRDAAAVKRDREFDYVVAQ
ncbi:hypothetical protein T190_32055 [Sinorhizobium meliloti CCBAU 01290]|nr:hypothetical protein T190_32055 [Sinorhizobium meliloti CCBAU 01290]